MTSVPGSPVGRSNRDPSWLTFALAAAATATAICMSLLAGWQRGGDLPERLVWVAIGVVLVVCAHLLPALCRSSPWSVRGVGVLLWVVCMATACFGHATFFVLAQQHAGERRASSSVQPNTEAVPAGRSLTAIMTDRASVTRKLANADSQRCLQECAALKVRRVVLAAKLDALNAEADDVRRRQAVDDLREEQRDALTVDPVTGRLATLLGTTASRVDLLSGLTFAAVLEGVACLLWSVALKPRQTAVATPPVVDPAASGHEPVTSSHGIDDAPVPPAETEVMRLARDVAAGNVRATVSDIRRHLGCSQAKATVLRRQLAEHTTTP
ncbi:hypothetical protein FSO04_06315 [Paraburkholderia madseniana]|uniref:Uncharacterized protein n=1 Tax=Paraburkholderia madseniana TaxID=2599607 RepID=A0A6N6WJX6_9BURK|nr:hypothetical protein [Paraburkholderia madseniana]KAE8760836.1 hypothetical protein FSO04_06315 [Paraburkholderia madseniana]